MTTGTANPEPDTLRAQLIDQLREAGCLSTPRVEAAIATVPRHLFLPEVPTPEAYANQVVITKRDPDGAALSSASQPSVIATMLEQLAVEPGHRVLEVGAGTGYNAALLRQLAGSGGQVTTVEIDPQVAAQARDALHAAGYDDVRVVVGDGALGAPAHGPYDRIIITAGAWDLPPAWWRQLAGNGRIVVPLRWRGQTRSVAFDQHDHRLVSRSITLCGFIPMRGDDGEHTIDLDAHGEVTCHYDNDQHLDPTALRGVLDQPRAESWSGVTVGPMDPFDGVWLRLTASEPGTCRITASSQAVDAGLVTPAVPARSPAIIEQGSLAYLTVRRLTDQPDGRQRRHELGAIGHGPAGNNLADRLAAQITQWNRDRAAQPVLVAYPAGTPAEPPSRGLTIPKRHITLTISW